MILSQAWTTSATLALSMAVAMFVPAGAQQPEGCSLPVETGSCLEAVQRYFFDTKSQECKRFTYSGCQGNANNFHTLAQCLDTCKKTSKDDGSNGKISGRTSGWNQPSQTRGPNIKTEESQETIRYTLCSYSIFVEIINKVRAMIGLKLLHVRSYCKSSVSNVCYLPPDPGNCRAYKKMFYYDSKSGSCKIFHYGGCSGNGNRFKTADECEHSCRESPRASQNVCHLLPEIGPCDALIPKLFYNASSGLCEKFNYGGCLGNENRFDTEQECQKRCRRETPQPETENICSLSPEHGPCEAIIPRYFYNANSGICEQFIYGGCEGNDNRFETLAECDKRCRTTQSPNICLLPPETGPCRALITSFYYNSTSGKCELFTYGGCGGNENRFETEAQCQERCHSESSDSSRDDQDVCSLPADSGLCLAYIPKYHFNITSRKCEEFTYGGCGGNDNRFDSKDDCESRCPSKKLPLSRDHCLLQPNPGPCDAIHYRYFYNSTSETCEQFIYGGCGGNDNRFETKPECQDNCDGTISPTPKEICKLPADSGPCQAYIPQFFYNTSSRACEQFIYGGCRGNENRFETQTDCQKKCVSKEDICLLLPETGPCKAHIPSYFYNATSDVCEQFIYGGCEGNENRFGTKTDCNRKCGTPPSADRCLLPPETGPCRASIPRFYYNATSGKCENFTYGGCQGNDNRFETENECYDNCGGVTSKTRQEICQLPADSGPCYAYIPQFFYNTSSRACEQFIYGGCRGNENRFETQTDCQKKCVSKEDICLLLPETGPCKAHIPSYFYNATSDVCEQFIYGGCDGNENRFGTKTDCDRKCGTPPSADRCLLPPETGPCRASIPRFYYNATSGKCENFTYGGCQGNDNRFETENECYDNCGGVTSKTRQEICQLPADSGPCQAYIPQFFYNTSSRACEQFIYGGCRGNENRFETQTDCQKKCISKEDICLLLPETGPCKAHIPSYFYNATSDVCEQFIYGGCEGNENRFGTKTDCDRKCGTPPSADRCLLPPETGPCRASIPKFYYNATSDKCENFTYGGCQGNDNRFETENECYDNCGGVTSKTRQEICQLPADSGPCYAYIPQFFYNTSSRACEQFIYGGCQGNENRFETQTDCQKKCVSKEDICLLLPETGPCKAHIPSYFYNATSDVCEQFIYGGCDGNENRFGTKTDCDRKCGIPPSADRCLLPPETGPCRASIPRFYYNATSGKCENFTYGGCQGNDNRFETENECYDNCGGVTSKTRQEICQLPADSGPCYAYIPQFFYNTSSRACEQFIYGGCRGNENRFETQTDCQKKCVSKEDICLLLPETGPCKAHIPSYFYNATSDVCEQFIYGGCEGNENRFGTKTDCDRKCGIPPSADRCLLPPETGPCRASIPRFYYNATSDKCENFTYGGCQGNDNRFETENECYDNCGGVTSKTRQEICQLPADSGPCQAYIPQFFYNTSSRACEQFIYGGCRGNENRFETQTDCQKKCISKEDICLLLPETGPCKAHIPSYFYNATSDVCEQFIYGGCEGNENRFGTKTDCDRKCGTPPSADRCLLPPETGPCRARIPKFYYNATSGKCENFTYGGCQGNDNRFETENECYDNCGGVTSKTRQEICQLPADSGPCYAYIPQFFYNTSSRACEQFIYGGCRGNENRFETQTDCQKKCVSKEDICLLLPETGPCKAHIPSYFYNATSDVCEQFIYGGCEGNENRFGTKTDCDRKCGTPPSADRCLLPPETGPCRARIPKFYYNATSDKCENFTYGGCQGNDNRFETENECYDNCGGVTSKTRQEICQLPADSGPCQAYIPQFFYNTSSRACEQFIYGGCRGNENRFETEAQCQDRCQNVTSPSSRDLQDVCSLPADGGPCRAYIPKYHFNITSRKCEEFIYGGCDGNDNSFDSKADCESKCPSTALPVSRDRCLLHPDAGPCYGSFSRYFYNSTTESCQKFIYGGCGGNLNKFDTEADCRATCSIP